MKAPAGSSRIPLIGACIGFLAGVALTLVGVILDPTVPSGTDIGEAVLFFFAYGLILWLAFAAVGFGVAKTWEKFRGRTPGD